MARVQPHGVMRIPLTYHRDRRGALAEVHRLSWGLKPRPKQWVVEFSRAGSLRGVHVHRRRWDYFVFLSGKAEMGLRDLRHGSPTRGMAALTRVDSKEPAAYLIPPGVCHGWHYLEPSTHLIAFSAEWDPSDEHCIHWADPELGIPWSARKPIISPRDAAAGPLRDLVGRFPARYAL